MLLKPEAFFAHVRKALFGGKLTTGQVDGLNSIIAAWDKHGDEDPRKLAYLLATTLHETARTMQPIFERGARAYFNKYEPGTKLGKALGNTEKGDGYRFRGTGLVQLTGRRNFRLAGQKLGIDLVKEPTLATDPTIAAAILIKGSLEGWFTGKNVGDYINASKTDYIGARRVINGTDKASLIAGYADQYEQALSAGGYMTVPPPPTGAEHFPDPIAAPPDAPMHVEPMPSASGGVNPLAVVAILVFLAIVAGAVLLLPLFPKG